MSAYLPAVANHLWESTLFAGVAGLLTWALRKNHARVRHAVWLAASCKFLVPFALLIGVGGHFGWRTAPRTSTFSVVIDEVTRPFGGTAVASTVSAAAPDAESALPAILLSIWACGFLGISGAWWIGWRRIWAAVSVGSPVALELPIPAVSSPVLLEPGVFGVFRPLLLLPEGVFDRLTAAELRAVIAHELCHVRHWDNLAATAHMFVETVFWFHPLVWWIGKRMLAERERSCDEEVLRSGNERRVYAEGILKICRLYVESPLVGVSGISGSNLKKRVEEIMVPRRTQKLDWRRKFLLMALGAMATAGPVAIGLMTAQPSEAQVSGTLAFEVASVKENKSGSPREPSMILPGGRFTATNNTLRSLILNAYGILIPSQLEGGPSWIDSARYDIDAKAGADVIPQGAHGRALWEKTRLMLRTLLADRFKLAVRRETKEMPVYQLVVAKNGPKLQKSDADCAASVTACHGFSGNPARLSGSGVDMYDLALRLSLSSDRPVSDHTGIQGLYDIKLQWNPFVGRTPPADDTPRSPEVEAREGARPDFASLPTLFEALEQQVGLKLEARKGPVEIYVIAHVERPSEN